MNNRLKYTLILVSTLIIGMVIGFLVSGRMIHTRVERMNNFYTDMGFNREFMSILRPTLEQRDEIMPILRKYAGLNRELMADFREGQKEFFLELKDELGEYIDEDQKERLDHVWENRKQRFQNPKSNHPRRGRRIPANE